MDMFVGLMTSEECRDKINLARTERHARRREDAIKRIREGIEESVKDERLETKVFFNANVWTTGENPDVEISDWARALSAKGYDVAVQMNYRQPVMGHGGHGDPCHMMTIRWADTGNKFA